MNANARKTVVDISVSLDGFVAGPSADDEQPLGEDGERLHDWVTVLASWRAQHGLEGGTTGVDDEVVAESTRGVGAVVMGRRMFSGDEGPWGERPREGWWGDDPPFRVPVFVVTHHAREPLVKGDTTFTFVTEGVVAAVEQARAAAGERSVSIAGGASVVQQSLAAGLVDELQLHVAPVLLGGGRRLLEDLGTPPPQLELVGAIDSPAVTHVRYRVTAV